MNNLIFDPRRFGLLLKKEFLAENQRVFIIAAATFAILIAWASFLIYQEGGYEEFNFNMFPFVLIGGGIIFTSVSFYEFNDKTGTHHYLSLPASTLEKFVSKWVLTAIIFPLAALILFWLYTKIGDFLYYKNGLGNPERYVPWSITNYWTWFFVKIYMAAQTVYLVGAIAFQKYTYFKTSLASFIANLVFGFLCVVAFRIIFSKYFDTLWEPANILIKPNEKAEAFLNGPFATIGEIALWFVLPALFLVAGFFKLKEKEA